jgi:hypothetical protein
MKSPHILSGFAKCMAIGMLFASGSVADEFGVQDKNQDGVLSGTEVDGLKQLDQDGDGEVSRLEFMSAVNAQRQRAEVMVSNILKERDGNGDGRLSGSEISGLEDFDKNSDKRISELELLDGFTLRDAALQGKSFGEVRKIAKERFGMIDITEDGRLTGTEAYGSTHFDQNADGRISLEEYILGVILSVSVTEPDVDSTPSPTGGIETILNEVVSALNDSDRAVVVYQRMHEKLQEIIDLCVLEYACHRAVEAHGKFKLPESNLIKQSKLENGSVQVEAGLQCPQGKLTLRMQILQGKIVALALVTPEMNHLDKALFRDLQQERWQNRFAQAYGQEAQQVVKSIVSGNNDQAIQMIHPSVLEQIGREPFENVCRKLRSKIDKIESMEIETFAFDEAENEIYTFTVTYLIKSGSNAMLFGCVFQRAGLCSVMTGMTVEEFKDAMPKVPSDDDLPLPVDPMPMLPEVEDGWIQMVSIREGVKFQMPGESKRTEKKNKGRTNISYDLSLPAKKMTFQVEVVALEADFSQHSDVFFKTFKNALLNGGGKELLDETIETKAGFPIQVLAIKNADDSVWGTLSMIDGKALYRAHWIGAKASKEDLGMARKFLESVVLIDAGGAPRTAFDPNNAVAPPAFPTTPPTPAPPAPLAPIAPPAPTAPPVPVVPPVAPPASR